MACNSKGIVEPIVPSDFSAGDGIDISTANPAVISADINTTNLKFTTTEINTIQDITTASSPTFDNLALTGLVTSGTWNATVIDIPYGGHGQATANAGLNALLPSQTGNSGKILQTDGTDTSWESDTNFITVESAFTSQTSVIITHNNGYRPPVFVINASNEELIPLDITHTSVNSFTVTFTSATTGKIVYGSSGTASGGSAFPNLTRTNVAYTILTSDGVIECYGTSSFTVTLPTTVGVSGQLYEVPHTGTGVITLAADGLELVGGLSFLTIQPGVPGAYPSVSVRSNNIGWLVV